MVDVDFYRGKRVLVTGHTGFKGAWLAAWLDRLQAKVTGYALAPSTTPSLFDAIGLDRRVHSIVADVRDAPRLAAVVAETKPQLVFHLAAQALVGESYRDPLATFATNVVGTAALLDACGASDSVRAVVVVTSDKCYEIDGSSRGRRESDRLGGHDPYSASKACAELVASSYRLSFLQARGVGLATARAGNVVGGGDFTTGRLVPDCIAAFAAGRPVRLRYPDSVRPWQHVLEPLSGYLLLAQRLFESPQEWSRAWNFGPDDGDACPVREVVDRCAQLWDSKTNTTSSASSSSSTAPRWEREPGVPPHETAVLRLDSTLARTRLGWRPAWNLATALEATIAWHRTFLARGDVTALMREQIAAHQTTRPPLSARPSTQSTDASHA